MLQNPAGLGLQPVSDDTSLDYHWEKSGWFQVYASADLQLSAWLQFSLKPMTETSSLYWMLPLAIYPSSDVAPPTGFTNRQTHLRAPWAKFGDAVTLVTPRDKLEEFLNLLPESVKLISCPEELAQSKRRKLI